MRRGKKNPPAQPHRKAKIKRRQPLSPSLLQPRDPCRPPEAAQFSESPRKRSRRAELCTSSQAESNMQNGLCQAEGRKKERMQPNFLPVPSWPSGEGTSSPNKSTSTVLRGPVPHPCPSWGNPTLSWGQSSTRELRGLAWKDEGCRSRGRSPPDPTQPSLTACSGGGEAGPPLSPPAPPFG